MVRAGQAKEAREAKGENKKEGFPVDHYSYSMFSKASSNPLMFKVNYVNGDVIDSTTGAAAVLGSGLHEAMKYYLGGGDLPTPADDGEAIKFGHDMGLKYLQEYSDGFIQWTKNIPTRASLMERYAFAYFEYIKNMQFVKSVKSVVLVEKMLKYRVEVEGKELPVPLKGAADFVYYDKKDRMIIRDHKFTQKFSAEEAIDGAKLLQAAFMYFLVYAETGVAPYAIEFAECKVTKNQDATAPQVQVYPMIYAKEPMIFEFFYRMYEDITKMLLGESVYLPNIFATFDKEVSILAYAYKLDIENNRVANFKKMKVDNITDFLKQKITKDGNMKKYMETVATKFVSASTLNYKTMQLHEKIKMKYAEHGIGLDFHSKIVGGAVTLYRFEPSVGIKMSKIEAYGKDIEQVVEKSGIRILAPIPDTGFIGFEVPNDVRTFPKQKGKREGFELAIGINIMDETIRMDIRETPHMLISGATNSGKSVFMNQLIEQIGQMNRNEAEMVLLDPKRVELMEHTGKYNVTAYEYDAVKIHAQLANLVKVMEMRYEQLQALKKKNWKEYNESLSPKKKEPFIFVFIDEFGDLIAQNHMVPETQIIGNYADGSEKTKRSERNISVEIKDLVLVLSQKARAAGIHLILTTQRPSVKIVDGAIKANFPTRVAFKTSSVVDSQVILDEAGAEKLLGKGDMLFLSNSGLKRLQGFN